MDKDAHLLRHLQICQRIFERLQAEGKVPWPDSPNAEDMLDSESDHNDA